MAGIGTVERISIIVAVSGIVTEKGKTITLKNESPGPKTMLGRMTVASGQNSKTDLSASALVFAYGILLLGSEPIALKCINLAPTFFTALATFSAPFHWTFSKSLGVPDVMTSTKSAARIQALRTMHDAYQRDDDICTFESGDESAGLGDIH
jgi:hypothetical protein